MVAPHSKTNKLNLFNSITPNSTVIDIVPGKKNINITVFIIEKVKSIRLKSEQQIFAFLVGDATGCIMCNFYDDIGSELKPGDIVYIQAGYSSIFKENLILYTPKKQNGLCIKVSEYYMAFKRKPNLSDDLWTRTGDSFVKLGAKDSVDS